MITVNVLKWIFSVAIVALIACGCSNRTDNGEHPASGAAADPAARPALKAIELHYEIYLARIEERTTITPNGILRAVRTFNKTYGPNDGLALERREVRQGQLAPDQMNELAALFAAWDTLSQSPYGGVVDGGSVTIRYGDKSVSSGGPAPQPIGAVQQKIRELADSMPQVDH